MDTTSIMIVGFLAVLTLVMVYRMRRIKEKDKATQEEVKYCETTGGVCCGGGGGNCVHATKKPIYTYFEDEELDRYRGRSPESYTPEEIAEWHDVYSTLRREEVNSWLQSIEERGLLLPTVIQKEVAAQTE